MIRLAIRTVAIALCAAAAGALLPAAAAAEPIVRQATGTGPAAIAAAVDQFRADLGGGTTAGANGSFGGRRREINWDGVPDDLSGDVFFPGGFFNSTSPRGAALATPGIGFLVSADDDNPPDPQGDGLRFTNIEPTYATAFSAFSEQRLFTPLGSPITDTTFFVPGTETPASTNGFGAVFTDVDSSGSAQLELVGPLGENLGRFSVPATPGDGSLSFVGVSFSGGERIARARVTSGAAGIEEAGVLDVTQGGPADLAALDDFRYGEPVALGNDATAPALEVSVKRKVSRRALLRGLTVALRTDEEASLEVSLRATPRRVELAKPSLILAERSLGFASGEREVKLKPKRQLLGSGAFRAEVRVQATDRAGNRATARRTIRVRR